MTHQVKNWTQRNYPNIENKTCFEDIKIMNNRNEKRPVSDFFNLINIFVMSFLHIQVPLGDRLEGLPVISRRLLQCVVDVEKLGGSAAVKRLKMILCLSEEHESEVLEILMKHSFYDLRPENIVIVTIPKFPGALHNMVRPLMSLPWCFVI